MNFWRNTKTKFYQMPKGKRQFLFTFVIPLVLIMISSPILVILGYVRMAYTLSMPGSGLVAIASILYMGYDSRHKWPDRTFTQRLGKVLFFER